MMQPLLDESDRDMLDYFWFSKGDLTRWCDWEEKQALLRERAPQVLKAWSDHQAAEKILSLVIRELPYAPREL